MTSLGIFGDSFAHAYAPHIRNQAWMFHLPGYDPTIYALCGSSLFYSYQKFLDTHHKHEKNIFCVTEARRWPENIVYGNNGAEGIATFAAADKFLKNHKNIDKETVDKIKTLRDVYLQFDNIFLKSFSQLMVDHIKRIRPDTIIVSCFWTANYDKNIIENSAGDTAMVLQTYMFIMLSSIIEKKPYIPLVAGQSFVHSDIEKHKSYWDLMARTEKNLICHLSEEMNQILAKDMLTALETGVWNPSPPSYVPHQKNIPFYYG